jgi:nicotinate-nucleotide--dimethylbenzimidazole phosphoribosyltransferase
MTSTTTGPLHGLDDIRALSAALLPGDDVAEAAIAARQAQLTKPAGSLGRLEALAGWLGRWQGRKVPRLGTVAVLVFAGNHGVVARGVSPFPQAVTAQMVENFARGGAAINQLAAVAGATLRVIPLALDRPTADFCTGPAMTEAEFMAAFNVGHDAVSPEMDLLCLGEMGIGNTTAGAALAAALFGADGAASLGAFWAGRGTGIDDAGLHRKREAIDAAIAFHGAALGDPLEAIRRLGGREMAAILGATLAARRHRVPVLLDGFVCTAAAATLSRLAKGGLDHATIAHASAEHGHKALIGRLGMAPLLELGLRLGEGSGAALAVPVLRAALACHGGMATFAEAGVAGRDA